MTVLCQLRNRDTALQKQHHITDESLAACSAGSAHFLIHLLDSCLRARDLSCASVAYEKTFSRTPARCRASVAESLLPGLLTTVASLSRLVKAIIKPYFTYSAEH